MQTRNQAAAGFTLIELMVAIAIVSILAAVAVPSYSSFISKGQFNTAKADTKAVALLMENYYQKTLAYKTLASTANLTTALKGWSPASTSSNYTFSAVSTASTYIITAKGRATGNTSCTIVVKEDGSCRATFCLKSTASAGIDCNQ